MIEFGVLGPLIVHRDHQPIALNAAMLRGLLALLLHRPGRPLSVAGIVDALWPGRPPATARKTIQVYVGRLREALADKQRIRHSPGGYLITVAPDELDTTRFRALLDAGRDARGRRELDTADCLLTETLGLWRGTPFADLHGADAVADETRLLEEQWLTAHELRAAVRLDLRRHHEVVADLASLLTIHPYQERLVSYLMLALYRSDRQSEALDLYLRTRGQLAEELGIEPGPTMSWLQQAILRADSRLGQINAVDLDRLDPSRSGSGGQPAIALTVRSQARDVAHQTGDRPDRRSGPPGPRQLPRRVHGIVGRTTELAKLDRHRRSGESGAGDGYAIVVLTGSAGVGKTTLALHWAHQVVDSFPDGQLYVNLRGFDPSRDPVGPADVLRGFLISLSERPSAVPGELDALTTLFRTRVAGRRMLIVLDNARDAAQVRPMLPGEPHCLVVVTSRNPLTALVATEGARIVTLDVFTPAESAELMELRLGQERVRAEPRAVADIVASCAQLPLAIAVAAAKAVARPDVALAAIAAELRNARSALDALAIDDAETTDVRAVFSWSYAALGPHAATLFRALGNPLVSELSLAAAASAVGLSQTRTRILLDELARAQLALESNCRFRTHDLLRAYARELALERPAEAAATTLRLLDHYLRSSWRAAVLFQPTRRACFSWADEVEGVTVAPLNDPDEAQAWLQAEHEAIVAIATRAGELGHDTYVWQLVWCIHEYLFRQGHWTSWAQIGRVAVAAAHRTRGAAALCISRRGLGRAYLQLGRFAEAETELTAALEHAAAFDADPTAEATTLVMLADLYGRQARRSDAIAVLRRAIPLYGALGQPVGQAAALNNLGWEHAQLGQFEQTFDLCNRARELFERAGDRHGLAATHDTLAFAHHGRGDDVDAIEHYERALELRRAVGDRYAESTTLRQLGDVLLAHGDRHNAVKAWQQAWDILEPLGHADLVGLRGRLSHR